jgi:hypothetical protein
MTAPNDHRTGLLAKDELLLALCNAVGFVGAVAAGYSWAIRALLIVNAARLVVIVYTTRTHDRARQSVPTDQVGEGV